MFQKTDEERKNQSRDEDKARVSCNENEESFNCDDFPVCPNFKRHCNLNRKEHKAKSKQIIKKTSSQRIRSALSRAKKQHESVRKEKAL